jgi:hypothetical protein
MAEAKFINKMISMTASQSVQLARMSAETGVPQSVLIRQALDRLFEERRREQELLEEAKKRAGGS